MLNGIEEPASTDRIAGLRYSDTLIERARTWHRSGKGKITYDPPVGLVIIKNEPITIVESRARSPDQAEEERIIGRSIRAIERITVFIEDLDRAVNRLDVMIRANIPIGIRRQTQTTALA